MSRRRLLWGTLIWLDALSTALGEGDDLGQAWRKAFGGTAMDLPPPLRWWLRASGRRGGWATRLARAQGGFPLAHHRPWFGALGTLYGRGASLVPTLEAWRETLEAEWSREWKRHEREVPTKVNLLMLLFFFPAAAFLLFYPLLADLALP